MGIFNSKWPFYIGGGVLIASILLGLYTIDGNLGMSQSFTVIGDYCAETAVEEEFGTIQLDYSLGLIIGIIAGVLVAAIFSGNFKLQLLANYDSGITIRAFKTVFYGLIGGFLVMSGIQISGEAIYGQFISAIQMSAGAWIYIGALLLSGGILAILLDNGGQSSGEE
ncbi:MAG: YeeE/YedE family protein [Lentisphaeria bacterium]|nr:YeeE/YedE family protein [Lentisphaeria bacterium]